MLDQKGQLEFGRVVAEETALRDQDISFIVMPLYHVGAKCNQLAALYRGCTLVMLREYNARKVAETLAREKVDGRASRAADGQRPDHAREPRRHSITAGCDSCNTHPGPMPVAQLRKAVALYGPIFMQIYGMTEAGSITCLYPHQHILEGPEECGPPACVRRCCRRRRRRSGSWMTTALACATGVAGGGRRLYAEPAARLLEQLGRDRRDSLDRGWLKTGDVGWCDEDGYLFIVDRKKEVIISGGENIYPREVEEALHFHPEVEEVAVIGVPDDKWGEAVKAFAVTVPNRTVSEDDLIAFCKTRIASYKKPKSIEFVERLPRLANQKIDKKVLREPYWRGRARVWDRVVSARAVEIWVK